MTDSVDSLQTTTWLTWNKLVVITLAVMLAGVVLGFILIGRFGFFAPPLLSYTIPIYLLLWLPVFVIGLLLRPVGSRKSLIWLAGLGIVILTAALVILGPSFNYTNGTCQLVSLPDQPVHYECVSAPNYQNARSNYVLRGNEGSPFVNITNPD